MDKVIGWAVQQKRLPLSETIVLVSGRASFELVQKALAVQIPIFCAVSAPSSLAVDLANRFDITLIGLLRVTISIFIHPRTELPTIIGNFSEIILL
jgi:FdhD protein